MYVYVYCIVLYVGVCECIFHAEMHFSLSQVYEFTHTHVSRYSLLAGFVFNLNLNSLVAFFDSYSLQMPHV